MSKNGRLTPKSPNPLIRMVCPSPKTLVSPRNMARPPNVTMIEFSPILVTANPLNAPMASPKATVMTNASPMPTPKPYGVVSASVAVVATAMVIPMSPATDPTERSTWPPISSTVAGMAMMPITAEFWAMLTKLSKSKKYSEANEK